MPSEIRNYIYTLALTRPCTIEITKNLRIPSLLQTNRQLRHEALAIWLEDNRFRITVHRFEAHLCVTWNTLVADMGASLGAGVKATPRVRLVVERSHNWKNLLDWCRHVHQRESHVSWVSASCEGRGVARESPRGVSRPGARSLLSQRDSDATRRGCDTTAPSHPVRVKSPL